MLAPPKFKFKIVRSFQDPLTRQLSEAVRIELRGEEILNSKAEYSRCRVSRLRVDMARETEREGKVNKKRNPGSRGQCSRSSQQEAEETLTREAEDSLGEKEPSNRKVEGPVTEGRRAKKRKMEVFEGWA